MSSETSPVRAVIVDERASVRHFLRLSLESEGLHVLGEASDASGAIQLARHYKPDILLVDFALFRERQIKTLSECAANLPPVPVVVTVTVMEKAQLVEAFRLGAHGMALKQTTGPVLSASIRSVMTDQYWLERDRAGVLVQALRESLSHGNATQSPKELGLTPREVDIIAKIASGRSNKEVGEEFAISERTVKHHLTNIFSKVGVSSRLQLALFVVNQHRTSGSPGSLSLEQDDDA